MTGTEFKLALGGLKLTQNGFADLIGIDHRTVRRWAASGPPPAGESLVRLLLAVRKEKGPEAAVAMLRGVAKARAA